MKHRAIELTVASILALTAASCKSTSGGSQAKEDVKVDPNTLPDQVSKAPYPDAWKALMSGSHSHNDYDFDHFQRSDLINGGHMIPGTDAQNIPKPLQGIWWMDGNPFGKTDIFSFAQAEWDFPNHRVLFQEFGVNNLTTESLDSFDSVAKVNLSLVFSFDPSYKFAQLSQHNSVSTFIPGVTLSTSPVPQPLIDFFINYKMIQDSTDPTTYSRPTWVAGKDVGTYHMRQILDADMKPVQPWYDNWMALHGDGAPDWLYLNKGLKARN